MGTVHGREQREQKRTGIREHRARGAASAALLAAAMMAPPAAAADDIYMPSATPTSPKFSKTHIVEWDLPFVAPLEQAGGGITVDSRGHDDNRIWFLSQDNATAMPRLFRFDPAKSLTKGKAQWRSWNLDPSFFTGGVKRLRPSYDRRFVFVRTQAAVQRVDTHKCHTDSYGAETCELTVFPDELGAFFVSDIAVDENYRVFWTSSPDGLNGFVNMLVITEDAYSKVSAKLTRWPVPGGGAGTCNGGAGSLLCLAGIDVYPGYKNRVFFSEETGNNIAELNVYTNEVKRWNLGKAFGFRTDMFGNVDPQQPIVQGPRQLNIDGKGKVWVITASRHLVSLDPATNKLTRHQVPDEFATDTSHLAPDDDVVGYTVSDPFINKVGMLFPKGMPVFLKPAATPAYPVTQPLEVKPQQTPTKANSVAPQPKIVPVETTPKDDGVFVEARISESRCAYGYVCSSPSVSPLGITANRGKAQGTFFYTARLGDGIRIGFVRLPHRERVKHGRDDDDCDDGYDASKDPEWHDHRSDYDDDDHDGVENRHDPKTTKERADRNDSQSVGAGQTVEYPLTATASSLAIIGSVKATSLTAQMGVEIVNGLGAVVATGASIGGVAVATLALPAPGTYKVRMKNYGLTSVTQTPTMIDRQPWLP
jgi:hypothetical protein